MKAIKLGTRFFDEREGRYITPDGVGCDPNVYSCVVEELNDSGDFEISGRQLFTVGELSNFKEA